MSLRHILLATLLIGVWACENDTTQGTESSLDLPPPALTSAAEEAASVAAAEQEALNTVTESAGLDEQDSDEEESIVIASVDEPEVAVEESDQWRYQEGRHFTRFAASQGTSSSPDKIEVAEIFWYGCSHCYNFEPYVSKWEDRLPADVELVRIPVMWNPTNAIHARAYYTAQALGKLDEIHNAMFREIHINNNPLSTEDSLQILFESYGVNPEQFSKVFRSFAVNGKLKRASNFTQRYQIRSVPMLVINGKYSTEAPEAASLEQKIDIANELVERERQRL